MATAFEAPAQFDRDLRSANKEWRRTKDASTKWSFGVRPSAGVRLNLHDELIGGSESQRAKARPRSKFSDESTHLKRQHNIVKMRSQGHWEMPASRVRSKIHAADDIREASRSITDLLPAQPVLARKMSASASAADGTLYSFDRTETTPGRPLALDLFVKTTGRETERLVEKEYEILDTNGQAIKGRKARRMLRKAASDVGPSATPEESAEAAEAAEEDDGFELV